MLFTRIRKDARKHQILIPVQTVTQLVVEKRTGKGSWRVVVNKGIINGTGELGEWRGRRRGQESGGRQRADSVMRIREGYKGNYLGLMKSDGVGERTEGRKDASL